MSGERPIYRGGSEFHLTPYHSPPVMGDSYEAGMRSKRSVPATFQHFSQGATVTSVQTLAVQPQESETRFPPFPGTSLISVCQGEGGLVLLDGKVDTFPGVFPNSYADFFLTWVI